MPTHAAIRKSSGILGKCQPPSAQQDGFSVWYSELLECEPLAIFSIYTVIYVCHISYHTRIIPFHLLLLNGIK
uniref:AlNc14C1071G12755 protein n=2 Tax=Albugo laibachii Nc14 TaxID=890382 RepID=F0X2H4_9STRA|nr:AlNc14C1071G12755 [Albugo laibachii Nc14]|eukprot:CCA28073.1 AlNc14C1071G12755 [Albugo laibachii Nc14]